MKRAITLTKEGKHVPAEEEGVEDRLERLEERAIGISVASVSANFDRKIPSVPTRSSTNVI